MQIKKTKIAILGSNSHIAKGLIYNFLKAGDTNLHLYTKSAAKVRSFLDSIGRFPSKECIICRNYGTLRKSSYGAVINCIGVGTLAKLRDHTDYFTIAEEYDNLVLNYLNKHPNTIYISFSSGAVYGGGFSVPAGENTVNHILVNNILPQDYYSIARINSEAKHRAFKKFNIVDLRIFSYFSRFADLKEGYFITELLDCILNNKRFLTDNKNFIRDYLHPEDLYTFIRKCIGIKNINAAFDVVSSKPVTKKEILNYFSKKNGLKYKVSYFLNATSATGAKNAYYSVCKSASKIGFKPSFSSLNTIVDESKHILDSNILKKI